MPWEPREARLKTSKADTPKKQRQWAAVANNMLKKTGSESRAIRAANNTLKEQAKRKS